MKHAATQLFSSICYCIYIYILHALTWCLTPLGKFLITLSATTAQNPLPPVSTSRPNKSKLIDGFLVFRNHLQFCCGRSPACRKMSTTTQQRIVDVAKHLLESKRKEQTHVVSIRIMQKWIMPGSNWHIISDISPEPAMHFFKHYLFHPTFSRSPVELEGFPDLLWALYILGYSIRRASIILWVVDPGINYLWHLKVYATVMIVPQLGPMIPRWRIVRRCGPTWNLETQYWYT